MHTALKTDKPEAPWKNKKSQASRAKQHSTHWEPQTAYPRNSKTIIQQEEQYKKKSKTT
jgi:hypothetical protein